MRKQYYLPFNTMHCQPLLECWYCSQLCSPYYIKEKRNDENRLITIRAQALWKCSSCKRIYTLLQKDITREIKNEAI